MAGMLNCYGYDGNGKQLVSVKQQLLDRQAEVDKEQDDIIQEIIDQEHSPSIPSSGIPATNLASAVQTSLGKADTAVQPTA